MLHDAIGYWRTKAKFAFVVGKGDYHRTRNEREI